ncbi:MAG: SGNH/GDSL hydrolase family protein [Desulfobacterales bacterium]|jgi:lysophospholipase L1-like esterase
MEPRRLPVAIILTGFLVFLSNPALARSPKAVENTPVYYLSLGTSLAAGVQADPVTGESIVTDVSYPGILAETLGEDIKKLRHVNLGCPGETSDSFIDGGKCTYPHGSQLDEALNFLHAHGKFTGLITIDLGANDVLSCVSGTEIYPACFQVKVTQLSMNLQYVLGSLREAAGPDVPIVGMNYYNPLLALLLQYPDLAPELGPYLIWLQGQLNDALQTVYAGNGVPVADVAGTFMSGSLDDNNLNGMPDSIELLCAWTWMCKFQNIHPNEIGYEAIAAAFAAVLPEIPVSEPPRRR